MYTVVLALHIFVCILLIVAVLLQSGKDSDLSAAFGGGSGSSFGPATPENIVNKITTAIASCFLILSLVLALMSMNRKQESLLKNYQQPIQQEQQVQE